MDLALDLSGSIEANSGETLAQLARDGDGIADIGTFAAEDDLASGRLVLLLETFNPQDREPPHFLLWGSTMSARVRALVDFLFEELGDTQA